MKISMASKDGSCLRARDPRLGDERSSAGGGRFARLLALGTGGPGDMTSGTASSGVERGSRQGDAEGDDTLNGQEGRCDLEDDRAAAVGVPEVSGAGARVNGGTSAMDRSCGVAPSALPRQEFGEMAQRMLRALHVQQFPNGTVALNLQIQSGPFEDLDIDLRLESGKIRATFSVKEARSYRLLHGKISALEGALGAKGIAAHPIRVDLRATLSRGKTRKKADCGRSTKGRVDRKRRDRVV